MKEVWILACLIVSCFSAAIEEYPNEHPIYNYQWSVEGQDHLRQNLKFGHEEERDGDITTGSYVVLLPDTRLMRVSYYADKTGFHPTITYEGTPIHPEPNQFIHTQSHYQENYV